MATWNLSVEVRAQASQLLGIFKSGAAGARAMGVETEQVQARLDSLGVTAEATATRVAKLGEASAAAAKEQRAAGTEAAAAGKRLAQLSTDTTAAARAQRSAAAASTAFATEVRVAAREVAAAAADIARLGTTTARTATVVRASGAETEAGMAMMGGGMAGVLGKARSLAGFLAGGALIFGAVDMIKLGNESNSELNQFQATTNATAPQMLRAAAAAKQLGNDLSLPASNAKDAEEAMTDLAKAGFNADQAISADRAALTLQAGLHIKAADAAKYLGDTLDQFGLGADQAAHAADVLAGASTGASGGIKDIWYALKYAGPAANALHISLSDVAGAVVGMGKSGIIGQQAGTTIRTALVNMAKPTTQMQKGLDSLNITAFNSQGKFKGLSYVIGQLQKAQEKLSPQAFSKAVAQAYGKTGVSGISALAKAGPEGYAAALQQVTQVGKAQQLTAAQSKGLNGAMVQLKTQAQQTGLTLYTAMSPALERITRDLTGGMAAVTPWAEKAINYGTDLAELFGPELESKMHHGLGGLASEAEGLIGPLKAIGEEAAADGLNLLVNAARALETILTNLEHGLEPIGVSLGVLSKGGDGAANSLQIIVTAANLGLSAIAGLSGVLVPAGKVVGILVKAFAALPGVIQTAVIAMLLVSRIGPMIGNAANSARLGLRNMSDEIRLTQMYAADGGKKIGVFGASVSALASRVPILSRMGAAFSSARVNATGFGSTVAGSMKAAGVGIKAAGAGLMGALGGPFGLILTGVTVGLGLLASHQQAAAAAAEEHAQAIETLANALRDSNGIANDNVRSTAAQILQDKKLSDGKTRLVDTARTAGISLAQLTDAYIGQGTSVADLRKQLDAVAKAGSIQIPTSVGNTQTAYITDQAKAAHSLSGELKGMSGDFTKAKQDALDFNQATGASAGATTAYGTLKNTVTDLANATGDADTRTRDLKQALDLLSGGSISLQAAEAKLNQSILDAGSSADSASHKVGGWGKALVTATGAANTTTVNGLQLYNSLSDIADGATGAASAAYTLAQNSGKPLAESIGSATAEMTKGRTGAIKLAEQYGLNSKEANKLADSMGLIPAQTTLILKTAGLSGALADLIAVSAQFQQIPGTKKITVSTLDPGAQKELEKLGYTVKTLPNRQVQITLDKAAASKGLAEYLAEQAKIPPSKKTQIQIDADQAKAEAAQVRALLAGIHNKTVFVTFKGVAEGSVTNHMYTPANGAPGYASGGVVPHFANGGTYPGYAPRRDTIHAMVSPGEGLIVPETVRKIGGAAGVGALNKWGRYGGPKPHFANGGVVPSFADGGTVGTFTYSVGDSPSSISDVLSAADPKGKGGVTIYTFAKALSASVKAAASWESNLSSIGARAGSDVEETLRGMGASGEALVSKLAHASKSQFASIVANLKKLGPEAQASLADYTRQLAATNTTSAAFQANLSKLAAMGYGSLAMQLASQGDAAAQAIAAKAVGSKSAASTANKAAKTNAGLLSSTQLTELVQIIGAVKTSSTGIHDVAAATGLGEDEIITVADLAKAQISKSLGSRSARFLADLGKADKGMAYQDGGIWEPGIYGAMPSGRIKFAEASTQGEAYMPLAQSKRAASTRVLATVAGKFGIPLGNAHSTGGTVVIVQQAAPVIGSLTIPVTKTGATANDIASTVAWQARRASRGGVGNR